MTTWAPVILKSSENNAEDKGISSFFLFQTFNISALLMEKLKLEMSNPTSVVLLYISVILGKH